ncbi:MAG: colicin import membrane protein, partial [Planctomycetaceae bacterium]
ASLAQENPHTAKQKRQDAATAEKNRRLRIKRNVDKKAALNKSQQLEADQLKALADAKLEAGRLQAQEVDLAIAERVVPNEEILAESRNELDRAIEDERNRRKAVTDDEKAMAYVAQIQADIVQNWSRPPSARNGMQALLKVFLVPTGEVVDVTLIESSGNEAFDRSVLLAVRKTERFLVPDDARQFERTFREFEVLFRPDDLRL